MLLLALTVAGCASLGAALRTSSALEGAGYQNVGVNIATGSGAPPGGVVSVIYSRGPSGNTQQDAERAEKIVWDTFAARFGALEIVKESGGCAGPVCVSHSSEIASATYSQLAAKFGPRKHALDKTSAGAFSVSIPGWALVLILVLAFAVIVAAALALRVAIRRSRRAGAPAPTAPYGPPGSPPWPPGSPAWPPGSPTWPPGPPTWPPGSPPSQPGPPPSQPGPPPGGP